jgi:hypothetical protein
MVFRKILIYNRFKFGSLNQFKFQNHEKLLRKSKCPTKW